MNKFSKTKVHWRTYNHYVLYWASVAFGWISDTKFQKFSDKEWIWICKNFFGCGSGVKKSISAHLWSELQSHHCTPPEQWTWLLCSVMKAGVDSSSLALRAEYDRWVFTWCSELCRASKRNIFRRSKTHLGPLRLAKLFWNKQKSRLINVHHTSTRSAHLLIIWNNDIQEMWPYYHFLNMTFKCS